MMTEFMQDSIGSCFMCAASGGHVRFEKIKKVGVVQKFEWCLFDIDGYVCNL